ncbi:MAG: peptidoglycan DD-metalloendopeptidase family protein [Sulfuriflexus sp.]|nr:peptidoglycan DD-metalloendopeptidase family protein [Sulfuriflexus sp.]
MYRITKVIFSFLISFFILLSPLHADEFTDTELQQNKLNELRQRIEKIQSGLSKQQDKHSKLRNQLKKSEKSIGKVNRQLIIIKRKLRNQQSELRKLKSKQQASQVDLTKQRKALGGQIRTAYAIGRQEYLKLLLNQQKPTEMGRTLVLYDYLNRARIESIAKIDAKVLQLALLQEKINKQTLKLKSTRQKRLKKKRSLEASRQQRSSVLNELNKKIRTRKQKLAQAKTDAQQLEDLMQGLRRALADVPTNAGVRKSFRSQKGRYRLPVRGRISSRYGSKRGKTGLRWQGVIIRAKQGAAVSSISHGRVAFADWLRGFGLMIIVDHSDGYMSLYGHNDSLYVETGDWIEAGEEIASVGRSGGRKKPALYFEIRHNGKPTNPLRWVKRN